MSFRPPRWTALPIAMIPFVLAAQQGTSQGPTCEQVFKDIRVFKGVPAKDLIPAMEFMSASLKVPCTYCHEPNDYSAETSGKSSGRDMVLLQRDINQKHFGNRLEVTCWTCHNGKGHPDQFPLPANATVRHTRLTSPMKAIDLITKHQRSMGLDTNTILRTGTMVSPTGEGEKKVTGPVEMIQADGGKFRVNSSAGNFGSDGMTVWRDGETMYEEPAFIFSRIGRDWRGKRSFDGLERVSVTGKETIGKTETYVVRGTRTATGATEEFYFDVKTGLLVRMVNVTRSTIGNVVTVYDYSNFVMSKGTRFPMKVVITFAGGEVWSMDFKKAEVGKAVDAKQFSLPPKAP